MVSCPKWAVARSTWRSHSQQEDLLYVEDCYISGDKSGGSAESSAFQVPSEAGLGGEVTTNTSQQCPMGVLAALDGPWVMNQRWSLGDSQAPGLPQLLLSALGPSPHHTHHRSLVFLEVVIAIC